MEKGVAFHLNELEFYSPIDAVYQVWLKMTLWFWRIFFISPMIFWCFVTLPPWKMNELEFHLPKDALFVWNWHSGPGDENCEFRQCIFVILFSFQFKKRREQSFEQISLYPTMLCVMFCWNWPSGSGEEYYNEKST